MSLHNPMWGLIQRSFALDDHEGIHKRGFPKRVEHSGLQAIQKSSLTNRACFQSSRFVTPTKRLARHNVESKLQFVYAVQLEGSKMKPKRAAFLQLVTQIGGSRIGKVLGLVFSGVKVRMHSTQPSVGALCLRKSLRCQSRPASWPLGVSPSAL